MCWQYVWLDKPSNAKTSVSPNNPKILQMPQRSTDNGQHLSLLQRIGLHIKHTYQNPPSSLVCSSLQTAILGCTSKYVQRESGDTMRERCNNIKQHPKTLWDKRTAFQLFLRPKQSYQVAHTTMIANGNIQQISNLKLEVSREEKHSISPLLCMPATSKNQTRIPKLMRMETPPKDQQDRAARSRNQGQDHFHLLQSKASKKWQLMSNVKKKLQDKGPHFTLPRTNSVKNELRPENRLKHGNIQSLVTSTSFLDSKNHCWICRTSTCESNLCI